MTARPLVAEDIPQCLELCAEAGWNQTPRDWLRLLALEPGGCFAIDDGARVVATATVMTYGRALAWIGMVLVRTSHRGSGLARLLLERTLRYADERGVACVKLDATELGEPVYRKLGFVSECGVERWVRQPGEPVLLGHHAPYRFAAELDGAAFGADRSALLWMLEREGAWGVPDGSYALGRPGANAAFFGPCVAHNAASGRALLQGFVARHITETIYWDRLADNAGHEGALLGFERVRRLRRMYRGVNCAGDAKLQFALAGFELG